MLCDWYLILSCSFPLRHIKHSNISHSFFWCIIYYWNLTAPLVVAASWITLMCVTTHFEIHQSAAGAETSNISVLLLLEGVIPGAFPVVSGKQTANHREAGQVVDSTDPCEESKERKSTKTLVARAGSATNWWQRWDPPSEQTFLFIIVISSQRSPAKFSLNRSSPRRSKETYHFYQLEIRRDRKPARKWLLCHWTRMPRVCYVYSLPQQLSCPSSGVKEGNSFEALKHPSGSSSIMLG